MRDLSEKEIARWEKVRARGKVSYVIRGSLATVAALNLGFVLTGWANGGSLFSWYFFVTSVFLGSLGSLSVWWEAEGRYQNTLLNQKIRKGLAA